MHQKQPPEKTAEAEPGGATILAGASAASSDARVQETSARATREKMERIRDIIVNQQLPVYEAGAGRLFPIRALLVSYSSRDAVGLALLENLA